MLKVDLNCDLGEGYGNDAELMTCISSANIACGFHAGDSETMRKTVDLAIENNVAIGAHPGYHDKENFGRNPMSMSTNDVIDIVSEQIAALRDICSFAGARLHHVKPHGALYNQAAKDEQLARAIADAVAGIDNELVLFGLSGSFLISEARAAGLKTASEVFADRTYQRDGSLTSRTESNALISSAEDAVAQALQMVNSHRVTAVTGESVAIRPDTICIHGDNAHAYEFALRLRNTLEENGIAIQSIR